MKFVFLIAGKELHAWRSKHVRLGGKMMEAYVTNRIIKLLEDNHLTAASELIEQDTLSREENK
jgi:hypothetical protein